MDDVSRVHKVDGAKHAVDHGDHVLFGELKLWHGLEYLFHVGLHELKHDKDVAEILDLLGGNHIKDFGGELVVWHLSELTEDLDLTNDLLGVILVLEDVVDELDGNLLACATVLGLNDFAVATRTDELDELVILEGVFPNWCEGDLTGALRSFIALT